MKRQAVDLVQDVLVQGMGIHLFIGGAILVIPLDVESDIAPLRRPAARVSPAARDAPPGSSGIQVRNFPPETKSWIKAASRIVVLPQHPGPTPPFTTK